MSCRHQWGYQVSRPVPSQQPFELACRLERRGVRFELVGSAATGGPARDLDILLERDAGNIERLHVVLAEIGIGEWPQLTAAIAGGQLVRVHTCLGPLDIHPERQQ